MAKLYIVPTPIGNLEDITLRALRILKEVDAVLAEDTRTTSVLFQKYEIKTRLISHHQHNEHKSVESIAQRIHNGESLALVSDAGTPGISDPGFLLIRECLKQGVEVECLPGATAFVPALVNSGFPCDKFYYTGFFPHKKGRKTLAENLSIMECTSIIYESPHRLLKTLELLAEHCGAERRVSVSRELTKFYEETKRGTLAEVIEYYKSHTLKGELVIVLEGLG